MKTPEADCRSHEGVEEITVERPLFLI